MNFDTIGRTESLQRIAPPLLSWFEQSKRELEWRTNPLPYYVWVSEIMLQQTRVSAVRPYFRRFIEALPDVHALALCPEERLLKLWEGLGYYSRVRNLQRAAREIEEQYGGILPADVKLLEALPGIGPYTAGAIASIAYGIPEPAVDGNVLRVLSRVEGSRACIDDPKTKKAAQNALREVLRSNPDIAPGAFNQALMELGALVCVPNGAPQCADCPLKELCRACLENETDCLPVRKQKPPRRVEERTVFVVRDATCTLLHKRSEKGLLAGLWELPNVPGSLGREEALKEAERMGLHPLRIQPLPPAKHIFTHVQWHMSGYLILVEDMRREGQPLAGSDMENARIDPAYLVIDPQEAGSRYSIPAAFEAYTSYLNIRLGQSRFEEIE